MEEKFNHEKNLSLISEMNNRAQNDVKKERHNAVCRLKVYFIDLFMLLVATKRLFSLLFACLVLFSGSVCGKPANDSLLYHIQDKIYGAFLSSFQDNRVTRLNELQIRIKKLPVQNQITSYWLAYAKYYEAVYYIKFNNRKMCNKTVSSAIDLLEKTKNKNSEMYALLAFIQNFSIQVSGGMSAATIASKAQKNADAALQLDSANIRAWYVLASNDYYTPVAFGGGKKCEQYLLKAISLEEQTVANPYYPNWGKSDAYSMLIAYYIEKEKYNKAREYLHAALSLYPDNYMIKQYIEALEDKE